MLSLKELFFNQKKTLVFSNGLRASYSARAREFEKQLLSHAFSLESARGLNTPPRFTALVSRSFYRLKQGQTNIKKQTPWFFLDICV